MEREVSACEGPAPVEVVLADLAAIAQLTEDRPSSEPARRRQEGREAPARSSKSRRCTCGKCRACIDNARWESVYQEKFADPFYYALREPKQTSALNGF